MRMRNPMHQVLTAVANKTLSSETVYRDFRKTDYLETIVEHLDKRMQFLEIENIIRYLGCKKVVKYTAHKSLSSFSSLFQIEFNFEIFNVDNSAWEKMDFTVNFPNLVEGIYFYIGGSKYYLVLSMASRTHVHSKDKIIFKHFNEMLVLDLDGIPSFNYNSKRVNLFLAMFQMEQGEGNMFIPFLRRIFGDGNFAYLDLKNANNLDGSESIIKFKDFAIQFSKNIPTFSVPFKKCLEKLKTLSLQDFNTPEVVNGRVNSIFGSKTSLKIKTLIAENQKFIAQVGVDTVFKEIKTNADGDFSGIQMHDEPVFAELIADELFKYLKAVRKTYIGSHLKTHNKLLQVFNKGVLKDCVIIGLFKNRLLQYDDAVNHIPKELRVSLVNSSGRKISSRSREVNEEYYGKLALFLTSNGKNVGSVAFLAPI